MILFTLCANHGFALFHFAQIDPILIYTCDDERKAIFFCVILLSLSPSLSLHECMCVCVSVCAMFAMNGRLINSILHTLCDTTYTVKYIHSIEAISFACDQCTKSHLFLGRYARTCEMCMRACSWNFIGRFVELCAALCCVVSCHVMKFNFDKYSYESVIGLDALSLTVHWLLRERVYSYL